MPLDFWGCPVIRQCDSGPAMIYREDDDTTRTTSSDFLRFAGAHKTKNTHHALRNATHLFWRRAITSASAADLMF